jgi:predicted metal-dependent peptidase
MRENALDIALMPGRGPFANLQLFGQSSEWYANWIKKDQKENPDKYSDDESGQFDDHSDFGQESSDEENLGKQIASKKLHDAIAKAAQECEYGDGKGGSPKGWGSVSTFTQKIIKDAVNSRFVLDPKKVLASFIKASIAADKKTSVTKRNRRLPGKKFGRRTLHRANIAISIDQSGSVSDELLGKVFEWLGEFAKFASFTVVPFDHEVFEEKVYVWKKGERRKRERVLCGGTDFNAPTKFVNDRNFDGHIVITDMLAPKPIRSKCQRMWLTDKWGSRQTYFKPQGERILVLE